jgi:hypothetical protein
MELSIKICIPEDDNADVETRRVKSKPKCVVIDGV